MREMKRYASYQSTSAPMSRRLGAIGFTLCIVAIFAKRFGVISDDVFVLSLSVACLIALSSLTIACVALKQIWLRGGVGTLSALHGTALSIIVLAPSLLIVALPIVMPSNGDLSTDRQDPPAFSAKALAGNTRSRDVNNTEAESWVQTSLDNLVSSINLKNEDLVESDADIVPRRYRVSTAQLHLAGLEAVNRLGLNLVEELPPDLLDAQTALWAQGATLLLGLKYDLALRIRPDTVGTLLDVRARAQSHLRDVSTSADTIRQLLEAIDDVLLETHGELARVTDEEIDLEAEAVEVEIEREDRDTVPLPSFKPYFEEEEQELLPNGLEPSEIGEG